ncbi:glycosyltransferase [soil metagenome]
MTIPVGIVIPAYNVEAWIGATLQSVVAQTLRDWECVVVDDGSTDGTAAIVEGFHDDRIRLIKQANAGVSAARNAGIAHSTADAILFLDGDDMLHATALERLHRALLDHPEAVLVFGTSLRVTPEGEVQPGQKEAPRHEYVSGDVLANMLVHDRVFWNGGQVLARIDALRTTGGYRLGMRLSEDWEFFCRLAALGPCVFIGPQDAILLHRVHPDSAAPRLSLDFANHLPAIQVVFGNPQLRERFPARQWRSMENQVLAVHLFETGRQNFMQRRFGEARRMMIRGLLKAPSRRRAAVFVLAQASQLLNRPLVGILRFNVRKDPPKQS